MDGKKVGENVYDICQFGVETQVKVAIPETDINV